MQEAARISRTEDAMPRPVLTLLEGLWLQQSLQLSTVKEAGRR
jgi:hypothetical protein